MMCICIPSSHIHLARVICVRFDRVRGGLRMTDSAHTSWDREIAKRMGVGINAGGKLCRQEMRGIPNSRRKPMGGKRYWPSVWTF